MTNPQTERHLTYRLNQPRGQCSENQVHVNQDAITPLQCHLDRHSALISDALDGTRSLDIICLMSFGLISNRLYLAAAFKKIVAPGVFFIELLNYDGVCKAALALPGFLIRHSGGRLSELT